MATACKTCKHFTPGRMSIDDAPAGCWTCSAHPTGLPGWKPKEPKTMMPDQGVAEAMALSALERRVPGLVPPPMTPEPIRMTASLLNPAPPQSPLDTQVGGGHYKNLAIQPMEYSMANKLDACQHTAIKYITRFRDKGGLQDLEKAKHCIDMLIDFERRGVKPAPF